MSKLYDNWNKFQCLSLQAILHLRKVKKFFCRICDKSFYAKNKLDDHNSRIYEPKKVEKLKCHKCEKTFSNQQSLKSHIKDTHSQISIKCETCGKSFTRTYSLKLHKSIVHEKLKKTVQL